MGILSHTWLGMTFFLIFVKWFFVLSIFQPTDACFLATVIYSCTIIYSGKSASFSSCPIHTLRYRMSYFLTSAQNPSDLEVLNYIESSKIISTVFTEFIFNSNNVAFACYWIMVALSRKRRFLFFLCQSENTFDFFLITSIIFLLILV